MVRIDMPIKGNIYRNIPGDIPDELFNAIVENDSLRIERIVSAGHITPQDTWYDQDRDEWVILLKGGAEILFEDEADPTIMRPGDHVMIPAHCRHRVIRTDEREPTVWLAVHFEKER